MCLLSCTRRRLTFLSVRTPSRRAAVKAPVTPKKTKAKPDLKTPPTSPDDSTVEEYIKGALVTPPKLMKMTQDEAKDSDDGSTSEENKNGMEIEHDTEKDNDNCDDDEDMNSEEISESKKKVINNPYMKGIKHDVKTAMINSGKNTSIINPYLKTHDKDTHNHDIATDDDNEIEEGVVSPSKMPGGPLPILSAGIISAANVRINPASNKKPTMVIYTSDKPCKIDKSAIAQNMFANILTIHEGWKENGTGLYSYPGWHMCELCRESHKSMIQILGNMSADTVIPFVDIETGIEDVEDGQTANGNTYQKKPEGVVFFTMNPLGHSEIVEICRKVISVIKNPSVTVRNRPLRAPLNLPTQQLSGQLHGPIGKYIGQNGAAQILHLAWGDEFQPYGEFALTRKTRKLSLEAFWPKGTWTEDAAEMLGAPKSFLANDQCDD